MRMPIDRRYVRFGVAALTTIAIAVMASSSFISFQRVKAETQRAIRSPQPGPFSLQQIKSYPFPNELTASATGSRIAWSFNEQGKRNIWVAEGPEFKARRLTNYEIDDGQELTSLFISADGKYVVYVRGGDHGSNFESSVGVNPAMTPTQSKVQVWSVPFDGGDPKLLSDGDEPAISPKSDRVVFVKER